VNIFNLTSRGRHLQGVLDAQGQGDVLGQKQVRLEPWSILEAF
jgi:hypothetical protein